MNNKRTQFKKAVKKAKNQLELARIRECGRLYYPLRAVLDIHIPVSQETYSEFERIVGIHSDYQFVLLFILFGSLIDKEYQEKMISSEIIEALRLDSMITSCENLASGLDTAFGLKFEFKQIPNKLTQFNISEIFGDIEEFRQKVIKEVPATDGVWLTTGGRVTKTTLNQRAELEALLERADLPKQNDTQNKLLEILHQKRRAYKCFQTAAQKVHRSITKKACELTPRQMRDVLFLKQVIIKPQPTYHAVKKTKRIYADSGYPLLSRESRHQIIHEAGLYELDLKSAQLVIVRNVFQATWLDEYLNEPRGFWNRIMEESAIEPTQDYKAAVKRCTYRIVFGGNLNQAIFDTRLDTPEARREAEVAEILKDHPIYRRLTKEMIAATQQIRKQGYTIDSYGNKLDKDHKIVQEGCSFITFGEQPEEQQAEYLITAKEARSLLAHTIQSIEFRILAQTIIARNGINGMELRGWMHDGAILKMSSNQTKRESTMKQIEEQIQETESEIYQELGIPKHQSQKIEWSK